MRQSSSSLLVVGHEALLFERIDILDRGALHRVAHPRGEVAIGVGPRDDVRHVDLVSRLVRRDDLGGRFEIQARDSSQASRGQLFEELKNAGVFPLVLAEGLVVHEKIHRISLGASPTHWPNFSVVSGHSLHVARRKTERDVVGEAVILQQEARCAARLWVCRRNWGSANPVSGPILRRGCPRSRPLSAHCAEVVAV